LSGDATFLQRLLVGWARSSGVKLVPSGGRRRTTFAVKRLERGSALAASSSMPAHAQGYFTATVLVLTAFDGFTVSPCNLSSEKNVDTRLQCSGGFLCDLRNKKRIVGTPVVEPGNWQGEILDEYTASFGQTVQDSAPRRSIEFSYIVTPAIFTGPNAQFA
jgi:hypothetical protein